MKNSRHTAHRTSARALLFGIILSTAMFFACAFICAIISSGLENPTARLGMTSLAAFLIGGAISAFATAKYKGEGGFAPALLSSLFLTLALFLVGLIMSGGSLPLITVINLICYLGVSALFALLAIRKPTNHRRRSYRRKGA